MTGLDRTVVLVATDLLSGHHFPDSHTFFGAGMT